MIYWLLPMYLGIIVGAVFSRIPWVLMWVVLMGTAMLLTLMGLDVWLSHSCLLLAVVVALPSLLWALWMRRWTRRAGGGERRALVPVAVASGAVWAVILLNSADAALAGGMAGAIHDIKKEFHSELKIGAYRPWQVWQAYSPPPNVIEKFPKLSASDGIGLGVSLLSVRSGLRGVVQFGTVALFLSSVLFWIGRMVSVAARLRQSRQEGASVVEWLIAEDDGDEWLRFVGAAMPSMGFLGTVLGIGQGLATATSGSAGLDVQRIMASLGMAFSTTAIALVCGLAQSVLVVWLAAVRKRVASEWVRKRVASE
jgi:hypothetical protein